MSDNGGKVSLKVSPAAARLIKSASRDEQLAAVQGATKLPLKDLLTLCLFLFPNRDAELKNTIAGTLRRIDSGELAALINGGELHPKYLELIARMRLDDVPVIEALLNSPLTSYSLLKNIAAHCRGEVFSLFARQLALLKKCPDLVGVLTNNERVTLEMKAQIGLMQESQLAAETESPIERAAAGESPDKSAPSLREEPEEEAAEQEAAEQEANLSKYQQSLDMPVAEKIKTALTGDKEWRTLLVKEPNKLVSSAVLKNPRITDGEVLAVVKNKTSSEELIRLISLNNEWLKNYEIKRALVLHNRTPLPTAMRFMTILSEKDLKSLAKSREVSSVLVNTARRMLAAREKKK